MHKDERTVRCGEKASAGTAMISRFVGYMYKPIDLHCHAMKLPQYHFPCRGMLARALRCRLYSTDAAVLEIEDSLRVASLVHSFRNDGHLAAALDPLRRVKQGPWLTESRHATTWYNLIADGCYHENSLPSRHQCSRNLYSSAGTTTSLVLLCMICPWTHHIHSNQASLPAS